MQQILFKSRNNVYCEEITNDLRLQPYAAIYINFLATETKYWKMLWYRIKNKNTHKIASELKNLTMHWMRRAKKRQNLISLQTWTNTLNVSCWSAIFLTFLCAFISELINRMNKTYIEIVKTIFRLLILKCLMSYPRAYSSHCLSFECLRFQKKTGYGARQSERERV